MRSLCAVPIQSAPQYYPSHPAEIDQMRSGDEYDESYKMGPH